MKRLLITLVALLLIGIGLSAKKTVEKRKVGKVKVYSNFDPRTGGIAPLDVCIEHRGQYFLCYTFFSRQNKDSIECMTLCRAADVSYVTPKHKPVGDIIRKENIKLNKRGRGKANFKLEGSYFLREPEWEEKPVCLNVSYYINTKKGEKSTVTYNFTEEADKN